MDPNSGAVQQVNSPAGAPYNQMVNPPNVAMVSVNNLLNVKDSRWLQLEVCREFQRNKCTRPDTECKFAHPLPNVEVQNGRVTACYDSIKGRCNREKPPCKYFHPPQHLKDQLLINGRNHLALKNALMTQIHGLPPTTSVMPGTLQMVSSHVTTAPSGDRHGRWGSDQLQPQHHHIYQAASPYLQGIPTMGSYGPYLASSSPVMSIGGVNDGMTSQLSGVLPQQVLTQKLPRTDRLEVCREFQRGACKRPEEECRFAHPPEHVASSDEGTVTVCMDAVKSRCARDPCRYFHPPSHLQAHLKAGRATAAAAAAAAVVSSLPGAFPGVLPYKRTATDKSGVPMFQPSNAAYQQALMQQLGNQSYVPVSCEYGGGSQTSSAAAAANALPTENVIPRTSSASPTITDITDSTSNTTTTTTTSTTITTNSSTASNNHNALVPVNSSKDSICSSSQASPLSYHSHAVASTPYSNMFSYPGYALHAKPTMRPAIRAPSILSQTMPPNVGALSPYAFTQPPPHQALGVSYVGSGATQVMPYVSQASLMSAAAGMPHTVGAGLSSLAPYSGFPAGVATGTSAMQPHAAQFMYPSLHYPSYVLSHNASPAALSAAAMSGATSQYSPWTAAAAAQAAAAAAAAAAGSNEQPYKKLKTV